MANYELFMQEMSYGREPGWRDSAACVGMPPEWFEVTDRDSRQAEGLTDRELKFFNLDNFAKAEEVCIECPVFFECKNDATDDDRMFTVRAGEKPSGFEDFITCKSGLHQMDAPGRCRDCHAVSKAAWRSRTREKAKS